MYKINNKPFLKICKNNNNKRTHLTVVPSEPTCSPCRLNLRPLAGAATHDDLTRLTATKSYLQSLLLEVLQGISKDLKSFDFLAICCCQVCVYGEVLEREKCGRG